MCVVTLTKQKEAFTLCYFLVSIIKAATIVVQPPLECIEKASDLLKDGCRTPPRRPFDIWKVWIVAGMCRSKMY